MIILLKCNNFQMELLVKQDSSPTSFISCARFFKVSNPSDMISSPSSCRNQNRNHSWMTVIIATKLMSFLIYHRHQSEAKQNSSRPVSSCAIHILIETDWILHLDWNNHCQYVPLRLKRKRSMLFRNSNVSIKCI